MKASIKRIMALGAASVALAGTAALGGATAASAAPAHQGHAVEHERCVRDAGHWMRVWRPGHRGNRGRRHFGYWTRTWHPAHPVCHRVR